MILSFGYHGNSAAQVQLIPHPGLGWYEPWTGLYIQETQLIPRGHVFFFFFFSHNMGGRSWKAVSAASSPAFLRERLPVVGLRICHLTTGFISRWSEVTVQEPEDFVRLFFFSWREGYPIILLLLLLFFLFFFSLLWWPWSLMRVVSVFRLIAFLVL